MQPGCVGHSIELKVEHFAALPAQAAQLQPTAAQTTSVLFAEQGSGVPEHEPLHLQPPLQLPAVTWVTQAGGCPVQAALHVHPGLVQVLADGSASQGMAVPTHFLPTQAQPVMASQLIASVGTLQLVTVPTQVSVPWQPLAFMHCLADKLLHAEALPAHTGAALAPAVPTALPPASPADPARPVPVPVPAEPAAPASLGKLPSPPLTASEPAAPASSPAFALPLASPIVKAAPDAPLILTSPAAPASVAPG